jgi:hypothetical protein
MVLQFHLKYAFQLCKILEVESPLEIKYQILVYGPSKTHSDDSMGGQCSHLGFLIASKIYNTSS